MSAENRRLTPEEEAAELAKPGSHPEWENNLPAAIQKDIDAYLEGIRTQSSVLDCLWDELYGSINASQWGWGDHQGAGGLPAAEIPLRAGG